MKEAECLEILTVYPLNIFKFEQSETNERYQCDLM